ncbi:MAG TPA: hypoxanthine phosphoribosyltransferase [Syntrophomonadaceae bacterium]|nr:hypoxanthine phosphoribosyltransferase [Syntrophomonadaceae bacterium]HNX29845.1 hypoxanthine phosphoribosyltransferase [Syntrophomonadaceae bacterium]HPR92918.1 hypoxanthine phosphoribosyltransferase [Syntrophomonadaceae bacterium]
MNLQEVDVLISTEEIKAKVQELGRQITEEYRGSDLLIIGILKGAFIFMADLIREIDIPLEIDFMDVSSYGASTVSSGEVRIIKDLDYSIKDRNILIVEDIIDSGLTLKYITSILYKREPASIKICCMLDKPSRRKTDIKPDFCGYSIEDRFIVGYGLDYAEKYREYPAICELKASVYKKP